MDNVFSALPAAQLPPQTNQISLSPSFVTPVKPNSFYDVTNSETKCSIATLVKVVEFSGSNMFDCKSSVTTAGQGSISVLHPLGNYDIFCGTVTIFGETSTIFRASLEKSGLGRWNTH